MAALFILAVISFVIFLCNIFHRFSKWNELRSKVNKLPGKKGRFLLGNLEMTDGDHKSLFMNINQYIAAFMQQGIARAWLMHVPVIAILSPDEAEVVLTDMKFIRKSITYNPLLSWLGTGLLTSYGEKWQKRRKILTPTFHFSILQNFVKIFKTESKHLVDVLKEHIYEELDIAPIISKFALDSICETAMGTRPDLIDGGHKYYKCVQKMGEINIERVSKPWLLLDIFYFFTISHWIEKKTIKYLHAFSSKIIGARKDEFNNSVDENLNTGIYSKRKKLAMLDVLISAQRENCSIDDEGIREEVDTFMFEGHDTTSLCLIYTLMLLANHKIHQDKIYKEIISVEENAENETTYSQLQNLKYMEMCIKESLRLYPSVPSIGRKADVDIKTKSGYEIPANCSTLLSIFDIHRRPDVFPEPEVFDPDRFLPENCAKRHPFAFIPFSAGPRNCIGQKFAMLELKCALTEILKNFILEPVTKPESVEFVMNIVLRPAGPIKVKFVPRSI